MSEFNIPASREQASPSRIAPADAVKNGVAYLLADLGVFGIVEGAQLVVGFAWGVGFAALWAAGFFTGDVEAVFDASLAYALALAQLLTLTVTMPWWWCRIRPRSFSSARDRRLPRGDASFMRVAGIILLGVAMQMIISYILSLVLPMFPSLEQGYDEMMNDGATSELSAISLLVVAVGAPISEEIACRGLMLEFSLRAVCPEWHDAWCERTCRHRARLPLGDASAMWVPPARFWIANLIQAVLFGILHMNLVQGIYAGAMGLVFGWVFWRSGKMRYNIGLHLVLNFSSYFVGGIDTVLGLLGPMAELAAFMAMLALGTTLFWLGTKEGQDPSKALPL